MNLRSKSVLVPIILFLSCIVINLLSWKSTAFSDWYALNIFPILSGFGSRITGWIPFSLGLALTVFGVLLVLIGAPTALILHHNLPEKRPKIRRITLLTLVWIILFILVTETMHCFILYHCTPMGGTDAAGASVEEFAECYESINQKLQALEPQITRTGLGYAKFDGSESQLNELVEDAMKRLGKTDKRFSGYYPPVKRLFLPSLFRFAGTTGIYFPYSLEANISPELSYPDTAFTACHELAHLKGIIFEDEANYIAYLACIGSDDPFLQYSGYIGVLRYFDISYAQLSVDPAIADSPEALAFLSGKLDARSPEVWNDLMNYYRYDADTREEWHKEQAAYSDTILPQGAVETIDKVSDTLTDTSLKWNGVSDGLNSYGRVVDLVISAHKEQRDVPPS